jgi:predicted RNase H-like HicB family nuclease
MRGAMTHVELQVTVHEEDGMYWAEVPSHPGLFASGETMDELLEALGEAWSLYNSDDAGPAAGPAPVAGRPVATTSLQVRVPA